MSNNELTEIGPETFRNMGDLRIIDLSSNNLRNLPDSLFVGDDLEKIDLSHNQLTKIPVGSITNLAALTLCEMDLSHNHIGAIHSMDMSNKFRVSQLTYACFLNRWHRFYRFVSTAIDEARFILEPIG